MHFLTLLSLATSSAVVLPVVLATLDPCSSNTKGACPTYLGCAAAKVSTDIQAAECSHNTRTHETQTFAVFTTDHSKDENHGAPYGTCKAYTCDPPKVTQMNNNTDCWTFFWSGQGTAKGLGTGCIRDPETGECGCENSDGTFIAGSSSCT